MNPIISTLASEQIEQALPQLVALFQDAIASGAALGFLPPLPAEEASSFWRRVQQSVRAGTLVLFVARHGGNKEIVGTVQLALALQSNGSHRAEVAKMMVHRSARRLGIGRLLLCALEAKAVELGRITLVLDTRQGDAAEHLYQSLHYQIAGVIPSYAQNGDGTLHATVVYYKLLGA
ncbi:GNAT family N-acetyltransferase [Hymenobacter arizonensis]|uniref:Acetyltransferase (GNAT) family protein n=1 Tax=Hymenobacter arizonensis TaxID=1227077 RepID=A0A1I6AW05_HYMAR|nr:GNAT family N-acetyltransferase [Hymenobacter arizonensis]SFQ72874.1 Acetyltransferase (GNAT) family protein [Hymenobacter arizonensis]